VRIIDPIGSKSKSKKNQRTSIARAPKRGGRLGSRAGRSPDRGDRLASSARSGLFFLAQIRVSKQKGTSVRSPDHRQSLWSSASFPRYYWTESPDLRFLLCPARGSAQLLWPKFWFSKKKRAKSIKKLGTYTVTFCAVYAATQIQKKGDKLLWPTVHFASPSHYRASPASYISVATRFLSVSLPRQLVTTVST
jgi:hypothetical protein